MRVEWSIVNYKIRAGLKSVSSYIEIRTVYTVSKVCGFKVFSDVRSSFANTEWIFYISKSNCL